MICMNMIRGERTVAGVIVSPYAGRRAVVVWPSSVIVYDSFEAAWRVHVEHMGVRGEETRFEVQKASDGRAGMMTEAEDRGWNECYQDRCEGVPLAAVRNGVLRVPDYIQPVDCAEWSCGYATCAVFLHGPEWLSLAPPPTPYAPGGGDR